MYVPEGSVIGNSLKQIDAKAGHYEGTFEHIEIKRISFQD
jgi:hypothetical protein